MEKNVSRAHAEGTIAIRAHSVEGFTFHYKLQLLDERPIFKNNSFKLVCFVCLIDLIIFRPNHV